MQETSTQKVCPQCGQRYGKSLMICPSDGTLLKKADDTAGGIAGQIQPASLIGQSVGCFEFLSLRNTGSKSFIFEAKHASMDHHVAIKILRPELTEIKGSLERFRQEAKIASTLTHPNSITLFEVGSTESGQPFLVLELLDGKTLSQQIKDSGALNLESFRSVFKQLSDVLACAHKRGFVHRDLKPDHVVLANGKNSESLVKLIDFGCSKDLERDQKLTVPGLVLGNADYMSPEQCTAGEIDVRSDIYSLGCIMYQALTGRKPFEGNVVAVMQKHLSEPPDSMKKVNDQIVVPEGLEKAIVKAMEKDPAKRQQSIEELWGDIERALGADYSNPAERVDEKPAPGSDEKPAKEGFLDGLVKRFKKK